MCYNILDETKVDLKREGFLSYDNYNFWDEIKITKKVHGSIKTISSNKEILIQKSDKNRSVVVLNRHDYITRMRELLSDTKHRNIDIKSGQELQLEKRLISFLQSVKDSISNNMYRELDLKGSQSGVMYDLENFISNYFTIFLNLDLYFLRLVHVAMVEESSLFLC